MPHRVSAYHLVRATLSDGRPHHPREIARATGLSLNHVRIQLRALPGVERVGERPWRWQLYPPIQRMRTRG